MKTINEMKLSFMSKSQNESFSRACISAFIAVLDPTVEELSDIKAAVSEAVTNCIVHAYENELGIIEMTAKILDGEKVYIKIKDKGRGIGDVKQAMQPLFTTSPEGERAGLGFAVMESFMDTLRVSSRLGKGTSVIMTKHLSTKNE